MCNKPADRTLQPSPPNPPPAPRLSSCCLMQPLPKAARLLSLKTCFPFGCGEATLCRSAYPAAPSAHIAAPQHTVHFPSRPDPHCWYHSSVGRGGDAHCTSYLRGGGGGGAHCTSYLRGGGGGAHTGHCTTFWLDGLPWARWAAMGCLNNPPDDPLDVPRLRPRPACRPARTMGSYHQLGWLPLHPAPRASPPALLPSLSTGCGFHPGA